MGVNTLVRSSAFVQIWPSLMRSAEDANSEVPRNARGESWLRCTLATLRFLALDSHGSWLGKRCAVSHRRSGAYEKILTGAAQRDPAFPAPALDDDGADIARAGLE